MFKSLISPCLLAITICSLSAVANPSKGNSFQISGIFKDSYQIDGRVALYPCDDYLASHLDSYGLPMSPQNLDSKVLKERKIAAAEQGAFKFDNVQPGKYYLESPPLYFPGENPDIDQIFKDGGCVYFSARRGIIVEVTQDNLVPQVTL